MEPPQTHQATLPRRSTRRSRRTPPLPWHCIRRDLGFGDLGFKGCRGWVLVQGLVQGFRGSGFRGWELSEIRRFGLTGLGIKGLKV